MKRRAEAGADLVDIPEPTIGNRDILVKVKACSICGTDVHIYDYNAWAKEKVKIPVIIGHEFSGEVVEVGKEVASVQEPLGNAIHTIFEGGGVEGKSVAIFGCGPIGIAAASVCKSSGAE